MHNPISICYGTRPQTIKVARLLPELETHFECVTIDTGQHYDYQLNRLLYEQLDVREPNYTLGVGSGPHGAQTASMLAALEPILLTTQPALMVVIGDTNSTLAGTLAAVKLRIPVAHVEAGLRAKDEFMPEEINRRAVDALASLCFAPSEASLAVLQQEKPKSANLFTGDIARDVLEHAAGKARQPQTGAELTPGRYIYATLHRAALTSDLPLLRRVITSLASLPYRIVLAAHPRLQLALEAIGMDKPQQSLLTIVPAVGYLESIALVRDAAVVITDSGGLQREAYWLGTPCITIREETEWGETVQCGANRLIPPQDAREGLANAVHSAITSAVKWNREAYGNGNAGPSIARAITDHLVRDR